MSPPHSDTAAIEVLAPILRTALDAVVVMRPDDRVADWNGVAETVFGWSREEAVGRPMVDLIIPPQHREAHLRGLDLFNRTGAQKILDRRIEITATDKGGREFPVELSVTCTTVAGERFFIGFVRDITERREAEARLRLQARDAQLLFDVTRLAAETDSFEDALKACLEAICRITGWPVAHAFVVNEGWTEQLVSTAVWYEQAAGMASQLRALTEKTEFRDGVGLPGTILRTKEPAWVSDADQDANFPRKGAGFGAAFGFPVKSEGRVIAILEFFARTSAAQDPELLLTVRTLGEQVGRVLERKRREEHQRLMTKELNHRVRNTLAVVQSIARQSFAEGAADELARGTFENRLGALAAAHEVLTGRDWESAPLHELVERTLFGCGAEEGRFEVAGPELWLPARSTVAFTLALHELCTNAIKYGAFSAPSGKVAVTWEVVRANQQERLRFEWREIGGPPVRPPQTRGFGSRMIEDALARELRGSVELKFLPDGLHCIIDAPLAAPTERREPSSG